MKVDQECSPSENNTSWTAAGTLPVAGVPLKSNPELSKSEAPLFSPQSETLSGPLSSHESETIFGLELCKPNRHGEAEAETAVAEAAEESTLFAKQNALKSNPILFVMSASRMRRETEEVLREHFRPYLLSPSIRQGGLGLIETPTVEEWNARKIELQNNKLSELPGNPKCPFLTRLLLHGNYNLMEIPQLFFEDMPLLKILDLSRTSIKSLPPSISRLVSLRKFYLKGCELLSELPPQIGALVNLKVFDLEGTEILYLPKEIGELISLRHFKVSLCGNANHYGETKQQGITIPTKVLSTFSRLEELSIDANPDDEWWDAEINPDSERWDADVREILNALSSSKKLRTLKLHLPSIELLQQLRWDSNKPLYPDLLRFRFTVGRHQHRIIYRLPNGVEKRFKLWEERFKKCLKYINGEGMPTVITEALKHSSVFFLDRHWTVKVMSEFGHDNLVNLNCCLLVECNELQTIIDGDYEYPLAVRKKPVFRHLWYLSIHYMKNLQSIWKGPIDKYSLCNLRSLTLQACPNLTTIFTPDMLDNLWWLEELIIEDCPKIKSLVTQEPSNLKSAPFMPHFARISLLDLPELVTISGRLCIGEKVDSLIVYNCPRLESLYIMEMIPIYKKIKGEKDWWDSLKWHNPEWSRMTKPAYEELRTDEDFMDQLAKDTYSNLLWSDGFELSTRKLR